MTPTTEPICDASIERALEALAHPEAGAALAVLADLEGAFALSEARRAELGSPTMVGRSSARTGQDAAGRLGTPAATSPEPKGSGASSSARRVCPSSEYSSVGIFRGDDHLDDGEDLVPCGCTVCRACDGQGRWMQEVGSHESPPVFREYVCTACEGKPDGFEPDPDCPYCLGQGEVRP